MPTPTYVSIEGARRVLAGIGLDFSTRQIKRAADLDAQGKRKLPFFVDPITGRLMIETKRLLQIYEMRQRDAAGSARFNDSISAE